MVKRQKEQLVLTQIVHLDAFGVEVVRQLKLTGH